MEDRIQLLDGAMGTQLEALGQDVTGPMWGSDLLFTNPAAIAAVHQGYADAGADLIETATYQMSLGPLLRDHSPSAAEGIMRGAIDLVSSSSGKRGAGTVLSLGPYGATLSPSQEYAGVYPPPYGPPLPSSSTDRSNAFPNSSEGREDEARAEEALAEWHLARLRIYAADEGTWRKVEWVGFETVPLLREVRAIRTAMGRLNEELGVRWGGGVKGGRGWWDKKFWVASAYPGGRHPQHTPSSSTSHVTVEQVLAALLDSASSPDGPYPRPDGIGINCTHPSHISTLADSFTSSMAARLSSRPATSGMLEIGPTFVLYPDGGATYDTTSRTWTERTTRPDEWAVGVAGLARKLEREEWSSAAGKKGKVWDGVIVGGCCKAGFEEIGWLRKELDKQQG